MVIEILGIIGSGKSTLARILSKKTNSFYLNTDLFTKNPFIKHYPKNKPKWSFVTGLQFSYDRSKKVTSLLDKIKKGNVVLDQGFDMGLYVYSKNCYLKGEMTDEEWLFLEELHRFFLSNIPKIDMTLFLDIPENEIVKRITSRGRPNESRFDLEYVGQLRDRLLEYRKLLTTNKIRETVMVYDFKKNKLKTYGKKNQRMEKLIQDNLNLLNKEYES